MIGVGLWLGVASDDEHEGEEASHLELSHPQVAVVELDLGLAGVLIEELAVVDGSFQRHRSQQKRVDEKQDLKLTFGHEGNLSKIRDLIFVYKASM